MKIKTSELTNTALNWAVESIEIARMRTSGEHVKQWWVDQVQVAPSRYCSEWLLAGPIIEREGIDIQQVFCYMEGAFASPCGWQAVQHTRGGPINPPRQVANTPLIAAMRAYVASKLGDEVGIPEELCK